MAKEKIRQERIEKLNKLRAMGVDPFGSRVDITGNTGDPARQGAHFTEAVLVTPPPLEDSPGNNPEK